MRYFQPIAIAALIVACVVANRVSAEETIRTASFRVPAAPVVVNPTPAFLIKLKAVCSSTTIKLTDKARAACDTDQFPQLVKTGDAFRAAGTGIEFNVLIRQN